MPVELASVRDRGLGARPRAKWPFVLLALGVVAVVSAASIAVVVHNQDVAARKNKQQAQAALTAYLAAWSRGNDAALTAVSTPAAGVVPCVPIDGVAAAGACVVAGAWSGAAVVFAGGAMGGEAPV